MTNKRDYYEVLGVEKSANEAEIKKAFKKNSPLIPPLLKNGQK